MRLEEDYVAKEFPECLKELTFNSKPIITALTQIAGENGHLANTIARVLKERVLTAKPAEKLPSLYLIDSILKCHGDSYKDLVMPQLPQLFMDTFLKCDEGTKIKLASLLDNWRGQDLVPDDQYQSLRKRVVTGTSVSVSRKTKSTPKNSTTAHPYARSGQAVATKKSLSETAPEEILPKLHSLLTNFGYSPEVEQMINSLEDREKRMQAIHLVDQILYPSMPHGGGGGAPSAASALDALPFIKLTSEDLQYSFDKTAYIIYDANPVQCRTCSQRYPDSQEGRKKFQEHMDWHFHRNRRLKDDRRIGRGDIFSSEKDWIFDKETSISGDTATNNINSISGINNVDHSSLQNATPFFQESEAEKARKSQLEQQSINQKYRIAIPNNSDNATCFICKERFDTIFDEDDDDWKYVGVVCNEANRICHYICLHPQQQT